MTPKEFHPVLVRGISICLKDIFEEGFYSDKVLERTFRNNRKWGGRDRRFVAETVYSITRWWGLLCYFLEKIPENQNDYLFLWGIYEGWQNKQDVSEFLFKNFSLDFKFERFKRRIEEKKENYLDVAFPQWLYERFEASHGRNTSQLLISLNQAAPVYLRTNRLKIDRNSLQKLLQNEKIPTQFGSLEDSLILESRQNVFTTQAFKAGFFEVQDQGSQRVSILLDPKPGERIADMCAGAGGKTLHLAALMNNKGSLLAADVSERKLSELKKRSRRAGVSNLRIQPITNSKSTKRLAHSFDGVLIDAPCSGSGVLRRNPDTKWKLSEDDLIRLKVLQLDILNSYSKLVRPGGRLVYATCSLLDEENSAQIERFLSDNGDFRVEGDSLRTDPAKDNEDGFFAQKLRRNT